MDVNQVEGVFFQSVPRNAAERAARRRETSERYRPPPVDIAKAPFHLALSDVIPTRTSEIETAGRIVFHVVGDTGGVNGEGAQQNVAEHMARQIDESEFPDQPSFLYHLGDVIYYYGEAEGYHKQFYQAYREYPAPIFAIPGNHDGDTLSTTPSLGPFMDNFCAHEFEYSPFAGASERPTMTQPNCYWRLNAPLVTIVGLYSNVSGELDNTDAGETTQEDWLTEELRSAPADKCLLLAVHHPLYSLGKHGGIDRVRSAIHRSIDSSGRMPNAILTGHEHCYQRFALKRDGERVPVLVAGAGGFAGYDDLDTVDCELELPKGVKLKAFNDRRPGFLRLTITRAALVGEYFTVPGPGKVRKAAKLRDYFEVELPRR